MTDRGGGTDDHGHRPWLAIAGGIAWTALMLAAGAWATVEGMPVLWVFIGPWALPGVLLAVWGLQRLPSDRPPRT